MENPEGKKTMALVVPDTSTQSRVVLYDVRTAWMACVLCHEGIRIAASYAWKGGTWGC